MNFLNFSFLLVAIALIISSCDKDGLAEDAQVYNVRVLDAFDEPFAQLPMTLTYNMGCTFYGLDESSATSDFTGRAQFITHMNMDTVANILERNNWDEEIIFQGVEFEFDDSYYLYNYVQNGEELINQFRPAFKENDEVIIRMIKKATLEIRRESTANGSPLELVLDFSGTKGYTNLDKNIITYFLPGEEFTTLTIPGGADLSIEWALYTIGSDSERGTLLNSGAFNTVNIAEGGSQTLFIRE